MQQPPSSLTGLPSDSIHLYSMALIHIPRVVEVAREKVVGPFGASTLSVSVAKVLDNLEEAARNVSVFAI